MAFDLDTYHEFVRLLYQHPELRAEVRQLVLSEEILALPRVVHELAEAQTRSEERLTRLEQVVAELAEAQKRTEQRVEELAEAQKRTDEQLRILTQRVDVLTQRVDDLTKRMEELTQRVDDLTKRMEELTQRVDVLTQRVDDLTKRMEELTQRVDDLTKRMEELTQRMDKLAERQDRLTSRLGEVSGYLLEERYRQRPLAYFGRLLTQAQVVDVNEVIPAEADLTEDELQELFVLDVLIRGQLRPSFAQRLGISEVWLAVEVSGQIEYPDVDRAWQRAKLLKRCGLWPVVGVVGGQEIRENAQNAASRKKVLVELERRLVNVDEIVTALKAESERKQAGA